ncbi:MAG: hypothetical protein HFE97_07970 [Oscillospiraceae bacterium]|nr:hypothetical protein [Oscillospiraceae bacterium]
MKRRNTITAILFLAAMALGLGMVVSAFLGGVGALEGQLRALLAGELTPAEFLAGAEGAVNQDLDRDHLFIQVYGGFQRLTGRRYLQDAEEGAQVVKLSNGTLNFITPPASTPASGGTPEDHAALTLQLRDALMQEGIPYLYIQAPQKIQRGKDLLPTGLTDVGNENADRFLARLTQAGTDSLDLRPTFEDTEDYAAWFFRTDHHWKPEGAFLAWQTIAAYWEEAYGWATDPFLTNEVNYEKIVYPDFFLGSQGKRVGSLYAGTDDFTRYSPKFDTSFTYGIRGEAALREGSFDTALLFPERVAEKDWFHGNPYVLYAGGDYGFARIINHNNPDGPRVLLIRDSFACALTPFLAQSCSELITVDLRYLPQGTLLENIRQEQPDLVMTLYTAGTTRLDNMFAFFPADSG